MSSVDDSLEKETAQTPILDGQRSELAIEVPTSEVYPFETYNQRKFELTNREVEALVKSEPAVILKLIQEDQRQRAKNQDQSFELEKIKIENEHNIRSNSERQNSINIRLFIIAFCAIFSGVLVYAARVNDKNLPNTVITAVISLLAGGSTTVALSKRNIENEIDSQKKQKVQ
jgi:hypothetical protein